MKATNFYRIVIKRTMLLVLVLFAHDSFPQKPEQTITQQIMAMDSLLFDVAFNQCNLALYKTIIAKDLEFYDDRTGLNTSIEQDIAAFQDKCSKPYSITRKLIDSEVCALGDFGAVQHGTHIFLVDGKVVETAKFTTVWQFTKNQWLVKRAISYNHKPID